MALKLNIKPEIEREMEILLTQTLVRSKTEYINIAIKEYNEKLKRHAALSKLKVYFLHYQSEAKKILNEYSQIRNAEH
jgi:hypothetical protein